MRKIAEVIINGFKKAAHFVQEHLFYFIFG